MAAPSGGESFIDTWESRARARDIWGSPVDMTLSPVRTAVRVGEGREGSQGQEPGAPKESRPGNTEAQPLDWRAQGRGPTRRTQ